jgi:hypothetical protein
MEIEIPIKNYEKPSGDLPGNVPPIDSDLCKEIKQSFTDFDRIYGKIISLNDKLTKKYKININLSFSDETKLPITKYSVSRDETNLLNVVKGIIELLKIFQECILKYTYLLHDHLLEHYTICIEPIIERFANDKQSIELFHNYIQPFARDIQLFFIGTKDYMDEIILNDTFIKDYQFPIINDYYVLYETLRNFYVNYKLEKTIDILEQRIDIIKKQKMVGGYYYKKYIKYKIKYLRAINNS